MRWVHALTILLMQLGMAFASAMGHSKARKAWRGRKGWEERLLSASTQAKQNGKTGRWVHVHCASLGEYEQAAPVINKMREVAPDRPILLTFFSPSGKSAVAHTAADHVDYLPWDTARAMQRFQSVIQPSDTILVKYELWPELISSAASAGSNVHLIAARFDHGRHPANHKGFWIRKHLRLLATIQVQDAASAAVLSEYNLTATVTGDPRIDRVLETANQTPPTDIKLKLDALAQWKGERQMVIVGSAWAPEWNALLPLFEGGQNPNWCILTAPHEVKGGHIEEWARQSSFPQTSKCEIEIPPPSSGLILDEVGILKFAYRLGDLAVVGGGWGAGVHNTLEPAVFGLPLAVGPKVEGFREIQALRNAKALQVCEDANQLASVVSEWMSASGANLRLNASQSGQKWVENNRGAADRIVQEVTSHGS
jgi:3-deoxy-D-manno-octulosonic-acid transferase